MMSGKLGRRLVAGAALTWLVVAGAWLVAESLARRVALAKVTVFLADHPGVRVGTATTASNFSSGIVLERITVRARGGRLSIGRLELPAADIRGPVDSARADTVSPATTSSPPAPSAGTIRADNVVLAVGSTTIRLKRIELAGTTLTNADLAAIVDAKQADSLEARLRTLNATAIVVPEIDIEDATVGAEWHALLRQVFIANVKAGKASAASVADSSAVVTEGRDSVEGSTGAVEVSDLDLVQSAHVFGASRPGSSEPIMPLFEKAVVNGPRVANVARNAILSATSVAATKVAARAFAAEPPLAVADPVVGPRPSPLVDALSIGTLDVEGFASSGTSDGDQTVIAAGHVQLQGLAGGKVQGMTLSSFHLDSPYGKVALGRADVGAFRVPASLVPDASRGAARPGRLDLKQIAVELVPHGKAGAGPPMHFAIDELALAQDGGTSAIPANGSAKLTGLAFDLTPEGMLPQTLCEMGYRHLIVKAALSTTYDESLRELTVRRLAMEEADMGSLEVALSFADVSPELMSTDPEIAQAAAITVLAKRIDLRIVNAGLFEKAIAWKAKKDGVDVADERNSGADFFANKLPILFGGDPRARSIGGAIAKFIMQPKTLHIALASKSGLGVGAIGMLGDPGALLDSLDVTASADD